MIGGIPTVIQSNPEISIPGIPLVGCPPLDSLDQARHDTSTLAGFQAEYGCQLPPLMNDERDALASLLHARLLARGTRTGENFHYQTTKALAERLLHPPSLGYHELLDLYGDYRHARAVLESLSRVGLLFDAGNSVVLPNVPVTLQIMVEREDGFQRVWRGNSPVLHCSGERVRVLASSRVALELRIYRVAHDVSGGVKTRSITRSSLARGHMATLDFDPFDVEDAHVEQFLLHASWPSMGNADDEDEPDATPDSHDSLATSVETERQSMITSAGLGWMVEYLLPRDA